MPSTFFSRIAGYWPLGLLLLLAILIRGSALLTLQAHLDEDRDAYRAIAENLVTQGTYGLKSYNVRPTAYRPPLYPLILAKVAGESLEVSSDRVAALHLALGVAAVWLTWLVARQLCRRDNSPPTELAPFLAGLFVACDPILLHWSTYVMTETLAAFLAILCLFALTRFHFDPRPWNAGLAGCALGLAILCRPTFLPWGALCGAAMLLPTKWGFPLGHGIMRKLANAAMLALVTAVVISPWGIRNYRQFGKPIITTTHGGYTFFLANNDDFYDYLLQSGSQTPWSSTEFDGKWVGFYLFLGKGDEISQDALAYQSAQEVIHKRPGVFAYSCLYRAAQLWSPLPQRLTNDESWKRTALRYATAAWYLAIYLLVLVGIAQMRWKMLRSPWVYGLLLCIVFSGVHTLYWSNLRMRAPLMPWVAVLAAVGASTAGAYFSRKRESATLPQST